MTTFNETLGAQQAQNFASENPAPSTPETPTPDIPDTFEVPDNLFRDEEDTPTIVEAAPETAPVEPDKELISPENKEDSLFAKKFAALSRKEKAIREREEKLNLIEKESPFKDFEKLSKEDPLSLLDKLGITYEDLTQRLLDKRETESDPDYKYSKLQKKVEQMEQQREEEEKQRLSDQQNKIINDYQATLNSFISENDEKYEFIIANGAQDLVYTTISDHYQETNKILSNEEAANAVEEYLETKLENLSKLKKFKNKYQGGTPQAPIQEDKPIKVMGQTLSNDHATQVATKSPDDLISKEEAMKYLLWDDE